MKKLKLALILLFAVLMSLSLFACKGGDEEPTPGGDEPGGEEPGGDEPGGDEPGPGEDTRTINTVQVTGSTTIELTDAAAADEATGVAAFNEAMSSVRIMVTYAGTARPAQYTGTVDYDLDAVVWGEVGSYAITATPTQDNPNNRSVSLEISIVHDFQPGDEEGLEVCSHDGATRITEELTAHLAYDGFHGGPTADSSSSSDQFKPFGSVMYNGADTQVPTYTAGALTRGMTITLKGEARTTYADKGLTDAGYYFPILGFAMREFDTADSPFAPDTPYEGGASVIVRNEGWVLMNGIGTPNAVLAGLVGGAVDTYNYGSHPSDSAAKPEGYGTGAPENIEDWKDWYVYSTGTTNNTTNYVTADAETFVPVTFTWSFRTDNIVEMIYSNDSAGTQLVVRTKVPASLESIETIMHGEYVSMNFTSISTVATRTLNDIRYSGLDTSAQTAYAENQMLDFDALVVEAEYLQQPGEWERTTNLVVEAFTGTATGSDGMLADADKESADWVDLSETPLTAAMRHFRVSVEGKELYIDAETVDNFITIVTNSVNEVYGYDAVIDDVTYANNGKIGNVGYALSDGKIVISPAGMANTLSDGTGKYIALRLYAQGTPFEAGASISGTGAKIAVDAEGAYADVMVPVSNDTVTITGLQETEIVIDLANVTAKTVLSMVDADELPVNKGGEVTISYLIDSSVDVSKGSFGGLAFVGGAYRTFTQLGYKAGSDANTYTFGGSNSFNLGIGNIAVEGTVKTGGDEGTVITVKYTIPALDPAAGVGSFPGYLGFQLRIGSVYEAEDIVYYAPADVSGDSDPGFAIEAGGNGYVVADGSYIYIVVVNDTADLQDVASGDLYLNVNGGDPADYAPVNIGFTYDGEELVLNSDSAAYTAALKLFGTVGDANDVDSGFMFVGRLDVTQFGVTDTSDYYFQLVRDIEADAATGVYHVQENAITEVDVSDTEKLPLVESTCTTSGSVASVIKEGDANVFVFNLSLTPAHTWVKEGDFLFKCSVCGAILNSLPVEAYGTSGTRVDGGTELDAAYVEGAAEKGLTVSFWVNTSDKDWGNVVLTTVAGNLQIDLPNLQANTKTSSAPEGIDAELWAAVPAANGWPGNGGDLLNGAAYNTYFTTVGDPSYATVVVEPGAEGGVRYYQNGVLVIEYKASSSFTDGATVSVADFVELFLACAEIDGVVVNGAKDGGSFDTLDMVLEVGVHTDEDIQAMYESYLASKDYYPQHEHVYGANPEADDYDMCVCGQVNPDHGVSTAHHYVAYVCTVCGAIDPDHDHVDEDSNGRCDICNEVMQTHTHNYSTTPGDGYGYCSCGDFDPKHGEADGTPHIDEDENAWCDACGELMPDHEHDFSGGACVCGGFEFETDGYSAIAMPTEIKNNDSSWGWWDGSTSDIVMAENSVTVITWENVNDKNYYDYAVELVFNPNGEDGDGQFIDFDQSNQWTAKWVSATTPGLTGSTEGTQPAAGETNAGYGTYRATIVRTGGTVTVIVEFTANGSDAVTWTRTATATGCPATGNVNARISGNTAPLSNFEAWYGVLTPAAE